MSLVGVHAVSIEGPGHTQLVNGDIPATVKFLRGLFKMGYKDARLNARISIRHGRNCKRVERSFTPAKLLALLGAQ